MLLCCVVSCRESGAMLLWALVAWCAGLARGNLEGPFLLFGPAALEQYRRPALRALSQDELARLYAAPACVVVFGSAPAPGDGGGRATLPRLRQALRRRPVLAAPQPFLDVHPDYVNNETQVLTLQGPWSERDAQMTETFARLQDIYGVGRVLGILGNSVSQSPPSDYPEGGGGEWGRVRRAADDVSSSPPPPTADDERAPRAQSTFALFNATGQPGKGVLVWSSGWPELELAEGGRLRLDAPVGEPTVRTTRLYTILVVRFADADSARDKITLELNFKAAGGWWAGVGAEVRRRGAVYSLLAPAAPGAPAAVLGKAYRCALPLTYQGNGTSLLFPDIQMQPFMDSTEQFADAFDCVGFTSAPIWSGLMVSGIMLLALAGAVCCILDIRTMDRFESSRSMQLTVTVSE